MSDARLWIDAGELLQDSLRLAHRVHASGWRPTLVVGLWRGGAAVAVAVHEALRFHGHRPAHLPLATRLYCGIDRREDSLSIEGLALLGPHLGEPARVLVVDDVYDTGRTMQGVLAAIRALPGAERELRSASVWYKPGRAEVPGRPDYHVRESDRWLVFPHELEGLDPREIRAARGPAFAEALLEGSGG